jgi:hypothetical protein
MSTRRAARVVKLPLLALLAASFIGCAAVQRTEVGDIAQSKGSMLGAAGFKAFPVDTPQKLARVERLPDLKFTTRTKAGQRQYLMADTHDCMCLYVGDQKAYDRYEALRTQSKGQAAESSELLTEMDEADAEQLDDLLDTTYLPAAY